MKLRVLFTRWHLPLLAWPDQILHIAAFPIKCDNSSDPYHSQRLYDWPRLTPVIDLNFSLFICGNFCLIRVLSAQRSVSWPRIFSWVTLRKVCYQLGPNLSNHLYHHYKSWTRRKRIGREQGEKFSRQVCRWGLRAARMTRKLWGHFVWWQSGKSSGTQPVGSFPARTKTRPQIFYEENKELTWIMQPGEDILSVCQDNISLHYQ